MGKIPWKEIAWGSGILTLLVVVRSIITANRFLYYGGVYWQQEVFGDPWVYVGMAAAAICVAALLVLATQKTKQQNNRRKAMKRNSSKYFA